MIDENKYVTKSKRVTIIKTLSIYNDKSRIAAKETNKKMTQKHRN